MPKVQHVTSEATNWLQQSRPGRWSFYTGPYNWQGDYRLFYFITFAGFFLWIAPLSLPKKDSSPFKMCPSLISCPSFLDYTELTLAMDLVTVLLSIVVILLVASVFLNQTQGKYNNFPPGPKPLPIIGNFLTLDLSKPHKSLLEVMYTLCNNTKPECTNLSGPRATLSNCTSSLGHWGIIILFMAYQQYRPYTSEWWESQKWGMGSLAPLFCVSL